MALGMMLKHALLLILLSIGAGGLEAQSYSEQDFLTRTRRLTFEGRRAGEGYFSHDGRLLVFQSERETGNPLPARALRQEREAPRRPLPFLIVGFKAGAEGCR